MKNLFTVVVVLLMNMSAFANSDFEKTALKTLMNTNPTAISTDAGPQKVNALIASTMTSSFGEDQRGTLSVISHSCKAVVGKQQHICQLNILNSDRMIDKGAYQPAEGMTESSLTIQFTVDRTGTKIIGKPTFAFAG